MKPENIIILRHGESEANIDKGLYETNPDHLMKLTDKGKNQCIECGESLKALLDGKKIII